MAGIGSEDDQGDNMMVPIRIVPCSFYVLSAAVFITTCSDDLKDDIVAVGDGA